LAGVTFRKEEIEVMKMKKSGSKPMHKMPDGSMMPGKKHMGKKTASKKMMRRKGY